MFLETLRTTHIQIYLWKLHPHTGNFYPATILMKIIIQKSFNFIYYIYFKWLLIYFMYFDLHEHMIYLDK